MTVEQFYLEYFTQNLADFRAMPGKMSPLLQKKMLKELDISIYEYVSVVVDKLIQFEQDMINSDIDATKNI